MLKHPSAFVPIVMSTAALAIVLSYAVFVGTAPQPDEGTAAHLWQLLMAGQIPVLALFVIKWLPRAPRQAVPVLALQVCAAAGAALPVWWFGW